MSLHRLPLLLTSALIGLLITGAIVCMCAIFGALRAQSAEFPLVPSDRSAYQIECVSPCSPWGNTPRVCSEFPFSSFGYLRLERYCTPADWLPNMPSLAGAVPSPEEVVVSAGWPFLAATCTWKDAHRAPVSFPLGPTPDNGDVSGGALCEIDVHTSIVLAGTPLSAPIPFRPIWLGAFVDVAIFGALAHVALLCVRSTVRWRRYRRGCCWQCKHPQTLSHRCPECGAVMWPERR